MSAYDDDISRAVLEILRDHTRHISGLSVDNVNRNGLILELTGTGWSPTLHAIKLRWQVDLWKIEDVDHKGLARTKNTAAIMTILEQGRHAIADAVVKTQAPRARLAASMGIDAPRRLPRDTSIMTPREIDQRVDMRHVMVDPVSVELLRRWKSRQGLPCSPADLRRALIESLVDVHADECDDGLAIKGVDSTGTAITLRDGPDGGRLQPVQPFDEGEEPSFDGVAIWHDAILPETALLQMVGRRVSDVLVTRTGLDDRTITGGGVKNKMTWIRVDPVDDALDRLI